ncbi:TPA: hypothetical protein EYP44_03825, partial [Candidatus Bathyarchaeota archaeon]|nr:hypothetical protein [Candidatus Bathyarchaeota archaeon]
KVIGDSMGVSPSVFLGDKKTGTYRIALNNKVAYYLFIHVLKAGTNATDKRIPPQILSAPPHVKLAFFSGYCVGDGAVKDDLRYRTPPREVTTKSPSLVDDLMFLISQIRPHLNPRKNPLLDFREDKRAYRVRLVKAHRRSEELNDVTLLELLSSTSIRYKGYVYDICANGSFVDARGLLLLHNTDSVFLENPTDGQIRTLIEWARDSFRMDLDVDKTYRYVVFSTRKKNYVGVFPDGVVDIKGLTGKKRNIPPFLKDAFSRTLRVLSKIRSEDDFPAARSEIEKIVRECHSKLRRHEYSIQDLAFNVMLGKIPSRYTKTTPQHVKAAYQLIRKGADVRAGDIVSFVKVKGKEGVRPIQLATVDEVDVGKYVDLMRSVFEQILDPIGISFDEMIGIRTLDAFLAEE